MQIKLADPARPLLVFGGPYSNLQAAAAMQATADTLGISPGNVICTGDVVAYAASPEQTARLIQNWGIHVVAGNCEEQLASGAPDCGCGFDAGSQCDLLSRGWYPFALANTSPETRDWMATLPAKATFEFCGMRVHALHGGGAQNNRFVFASQKTELAEETSGLDADIVLAGHCGVPFVSRVGHRTWLNAGVIGLPANDGTPAGWYALLSPDCDDNSNCIRISLRRLDYDHVTAAAAMRRSGHANGYARTLVTGIWPSHDVLPADEKLQTGIKLRQTSVLVKKPIAAAA